MNKTIMERIADLEQRSAHTVPTFQEFVGEWESMDELSKSLFCSLAADPESAGGGSFGRYIRGIAPYLRKLGLVDDAPSLREIAAQLDGGGGDA